MMKSGAHYREKHPNIFLRKDRFPMANIVSLFFCTLCIPLFILLSIRILYYDRSVKFNINVQEFDRTNSSVIRSRKVGENCNLFKGQWILDERGPLYTNYSCSFIPFLKNCFLHGRKDTEFLHWKWKPDGCELPQFSPESFLAVVRGKTMAFIGDSLARNQMESLVCLLSTVERPNGVEKDSEDRYTKWEFPKHNFTLMTLWSQFLVVSKDRVVNGSSMGGFQLHLDRVDPIWSEKLPSLDYAIFSDAHWFFRQNYLYEGGKVIGCVYCQAPNVSDVGPGVAIRKAFRAALNAVNECRNCKKISVWLRTYSPSHFEEGAWNKGGGCNKTMPFGREEIDRSSVDWEYRKIQMEEVEIAKSKNIHEFGVMDVTEMMWLRRDGHPGLYWGNRWMKGYSDCIHWCLPGPIDVWNQLLLELINTNKLDS